jgi:hypothetical protein
VLDGLDEWRAGLEVLDAASDVEAADVVVAPSRLAVEAWNTRARRSSSRECVNGAFAVATTRLGDSSSADRGTANAGAAARPAGARVLRAGARRRSPLEGGRGCTARASSSHTGCSLHGPRRSSVREAALPQLPAPITPLRGRGAFVPPPVLRVRRAAEATSVPSGAVGVIAALCWFSHSLSAREQQSPREVKRPAAERKQISDSVSARSTSTDPPSDRVEADARSAAKPCRPLAGDGASRSACIDSA